jgi:L-seryl-tRNA(Ser) seleniumtransferase
MKAGKEEIMGLLAAAEQWVVRDHEAEEREWDRRLQVITDAATSFDTVTTSLRTPYPSNIAPHLSIQWDAEKLGVSAAEVREELSAGEPRIEMSGGADGLTINPYMMEEGEEVVVAQRLKEALSA